MVITYYADSQLISRLNPTNDLITLLTQLFGFFIFLSGVEETGVVKDDC
jgi:hypothetical protein